MSTQQGPRPTAQYVERQLLTRLPATPDLPSGKDSNSIAFQSAQPTATPGDGLRIAGLFAIVVSLYPDPGTTLSGAGSLKCWVYSPYQNRWARFPSNDVDLSDATSTPAYGVVFQNVSRLGMLINWLASGVTASGGATEVTVRLDGFASTGPRGT